MVIWKFHRFSQEISSENVDKLSAYLERVTRKTAIYVFLQAHMNKRWFGGPDLNPEQF